MPQIKLDKKFQTLLNCPICKTKLELQGEHYQCQNVECSFLFPILNGIPILINEGTSLFYIDDFLNQRKTFFDPSYKKNKIKQIIQKVLPDISKNIKGRENHEKFAQILLKQSQSAKVLVIGGSILGEGMTAILSHPSIELVESDVSFGPRTTLICDAHSIPFEDNAFDGVIVQAVLEHVVDPWRCVEEIHRVLKVDGIVYAETPFMQQVHAGCYDFTRFTHLGHRRLFRKFDEIESGAVCGPGMALAWSYQYLLTSFTTQKFMRMLMIFFARITAFFWKYLDYLLINKPGTLDAASGYYFMGKKSNLVLSDRELIKLYKGAF